MLGVISFDLMQVTIYESKYHTFIHVSTSIAVRTSTFYFVRGMSSKSQVAFATINLNKLNNEESNKANPNKREGILVSYRDLWSTDV